ncbi:hypothetical protein PSPO01_16034 [Paraphaeosphaeria sporulosa]
MLIELLNCLRQSGYDSIYGESICGIWMRWASH